MLKKLFSLTVAAALALSSFQAQAFSSVFSASLSVDSVNSYASVTEAAFKNSPVSVFNIQDLHFNSETQKKIFSLLEKLNESYPGMELYVEGASENSDFEWVFTSLGKKNGNVFLEAFFDSGNMSGAEYFAAKHGKKINPVEDKQIFNKNLMLFAELIEQRREIESLINPLESSLSELRNKYFTSEQKRLFSAYKKYRDGVMPDSDYFDSLKKESFKNGIDLSDYPNLSLYVLTNGSVVSVSQKKLQAQMSALFSNLKNILSYKQYSELIAMSNNLKDRQALVSYLYQNRDKVDLNRYPELNKFIVSIALSDKLNRLEFINEENSLSKALFEKVSDNENSKNILFMSRFIDAYKNVLMTSATADEYRYFKNNVSKFKNLFSQYVSANGFERLNAVEAKACDFNDANLRRNEIFIGKMMGDIDTPAGIYPVSHFGVESNAKAVLENSPKTKVKVIVAGGFHTDGINEILNKKQISNITFMPKITSGAAEQSQKYVEYARALHSAAAAAIPLPTYNELPLPALSGRVLDALFSERANKGFTLSSPAIKEGVESFLAGRKDIRNVEFSYDAASDKAVISYADSAGNKNSVSYDGKQAASKGVSQTNLTTLGNIVPGMVRSMLKGAAFNINNTVPNLFARIVRDSEFYGERYNGSDLKLLHKDINTGKFDYEGFFAGLPGLLNTFIIRTLSSLRNINDEYPNIYEELKEKAYILLGYDKIDVRIVDSPFLINEEGWCLAALRSSDDGRSATLYIHSEFLESLRNKSSGERENILQELIMHETMENNALYNADSPEYAYFGQYLRKNEIGEDGRTTIGFHDFISSPQFKHMLRETDMTAASQKGQEALLRFGNDVRLEAWSRHEKIQNIHKINSFGTIDKQTKDDLIMLRLGDPDVIKKYADEISEHIKNNILTDDASFAIAVRHTRPMHVMQKIGQLVHEKTGIEIVNVTQDEYMDYAPMVGQVARENISGKFGISSESADSVSDKNIIILEDVTKTGFVFDEMSKPLNKAGASKIIPVTIFNIIDALAPKNIRGVQANTSINELFNVNDYLTTYMRSNPEKIAKKIIDMEGNTTKYFYYALSALLKTDQKAFAIIIERLNEEDAAKAKSALLENMSQMHTMYPNTASNIIPLMFFIENNTTPDKVKESKYSLTEPFERYRKDAFKGSKGILDITSEDLVKWDEFKWLIPLYCRLHGYTKISIKLHEAKRTPQTDLMLRSAQQLNINVVYQYQSEQMPELKDEELKKKIREVIEDKNFTAAVEAARKSFGEAILANSDNKGLFADKEANEAYKNAVKKIMADVNEIVRDIIAEKGHHLNADSYSVVIGGSLVSGSATPSSDIYYDIIAQDEGTAASIQNNFLQAYQYALERTGLVPFMANGMKIDYPGSTESSLTTMLDATIYDERSIATFFDFEPVYDNNADDSKALKNYRQHVFEVLMTKTRSKETMETRNRILTIMRQSIASVSKPYYKIIEDSSYSIQDRAEHTFFGNLYVSAYSNSIMKAYDFRWVIRGLDVALKEILLQNADKIDSLDSLPKDKKELIMYMHDKGMFNNNFSKKEAEALQNHLRALTKYRQEKISRGQEYSWTDMTKAENDAIQAIHKFIGTNIKLVLRSDKSDLMISVEENDEISKYVVGRYTFEQHEKVKRKIERYEKWAGKNASIDMSRALLLSEFSQDEIVKVGGIIDQLGLKNKAAMKSNIDMLFSVRRFPTIDKVRGDFGIQNYMDAILKRADRVDRVYAVFADKVSDFLTMNPLEKFFESHAVEEFLDYDKLAGYYMSKEQPALNEMLKTLPYDELKSLILKDYRHNTPADIAKRLMSTGSISELLDKNKLARSLRDGALRQLGSNESLKSMIESGHIVNLFTESGAETVNREVRLAVNLEKLSIYLIYIPLARRINDINLFEDIRNQLFSVTQPEIKFEVQQILEEHVKTELHYPQYEQMLADLKKKVNAVLKEYKISKPAVHTRVKSIYSIFEKLVSGRKGEPVDLSKEAIKDKIRDIYGFHIVVDSNETEKTMNAVEKAFEQSKFNSNSRLYTLVRDKKTGEIARKFDYDISKGFARVKYTYEINGLAVGEIIIYSREEYENEHNGLITRADPVIDEISAASVKKSERNFILTFPLAHWIYKMGENIQTGLKYADSVFKMQLKYSQLFYKDEESLGEIERIMGAPEFYFSSDDIILDDNSEDTLRKILQKKMEGKRAYFVTMPDGSVYPLMLNSGRGNYYEILAAAGLNADKDYVLKDMEGNTVDPMSEKPLDLFLRLERSEGANPFDRNFEDKEIASFSSLRAKILAHLRGRAPGKVAPSEYFAKFSQEEQASIEIYLNSLGLKNIEELYYAENILPATAEDIDGNINKEKPDYINKKELETFVNKRKDVVFEIKGTFSVENNGKQIAETDMLEVLERFGQSVYAQGDADKGEIMYKVIYSGNSDKVREMIDAFKEKGFTLVTYENVNKEKVSALQQRKVYMNAFQALGRNIASLVGELQFAAAGSAVLAANALIAMFNDSRVNKALDGLFYDEKFLIMKVEAAELLESVQNILAAADSKYENYDFDLQISNNENLIKDSDTYAFASLSEQSGRVTLYVNETFLRAVEGLDAQERSFYLKQLAAHEGMERASFLKGETGSYKEFHDSLYQSNPDQAKLMEFAARVAKEEMARRDKKQTAESVAAALMRSDELTADNPADFILLCGNDETATFEKTIELYESGAIKEMIVVSGGVGRLTLPLIRRAVDMGIPVKLSDGRTVTISQEVDALAKLSDAELRTLVTMKEADIIEAILLNIAMLRGMDRREVDKDIKIVKEDRSTNTRENFDNDVVKNIIKDIRVSNGGRPVRMAYIQTPMQQLRTKATFNSVFKDEIINGEVQGVSVTVSDFYKGMLTESITRQAAGELLRIIIYSLKGDTLPSINDNGFIFDGVLDAGSFIRITSLLENSRFRKDIRKEMLNLINNTKDQNGNVLFPDKESIIEALSDKVRQDSYLFESMKTFLDFIYYDAEHGVRYKGIAKKAFRDSADISKPVSAARKAAVKAGLGRPDKVFVFDIENASSNADLISYMNSFDARAFSVTQKKYINPDDVLFTLTVNTGVRDVKVKAALKKTETEKGTFYDIQYSVPFVYEISAADADKEARAGVLEAVFANGEIMEKLKAEGLDLAGVKDRLFVESLPQDKKLTTVNAVAQRIAESSGVSGDMRKVERKTEKKGLYNEKLPVAAMLRKSGDTGIGEITALQAYADEVLKQAGVNGFTMYDISDSEYPLAANYLLLDWMSVPEAKEVLTRQDLVADLSESKETINKEAVARRKILAAVKVYEKLSSEQRAEADMYRTANASWIDSFAAREKAKYNIDIDPETFAKIMALQQMFFNRQLKETVLKMADMDISMYIKDLNSVNAEAVISKWISLGITSFVADMDHADENALDAMASAASKAGFFINVSVKSRNMDRQTANTISDFGYTPIIPFQDLSSYGNIAGLKTEIDDYTFKETGLNLEKLLNSAAQSGAQSVVYPIGLLWGEPVSENSLQDYRVPAKGSARFGGYNFGLFKVGQKTFEESYAGSYVNAVETGLNMDIGKTSFDLSSVKTVEINGKSLPSAYVAAFVGSLAKQNKLSEIKNFEKVMISLINELGTKENLKTARQYLDNLLSAYNSSEGKQQEINAAKIAGFMQGLSENIIINGREDRFGSNAMAKIYANLIAEASLFKAGYYPSSYAGALPAENLLERVKDVLSKQTLANAMLEIEPMLLNLSVPVQRNGFTFDVLTSGEMEQSKDKSEKAAGIYAEITNYMLDIFIDRVATRDQIRKSVRISSMEAVRSMMSAA